MSSKIMKTNFQRLLMFLIAATAVMSLTIAGRAQTVAPAASTVAQSPTTAPTTAPATLPEKTQPRRLPRRASTPPATVTVVADRAKVAPQVVTIVHRLSGVKMLRFLLRQGEDPDTVYTISPEAISGDAHASIIAGWALNDGRTIAVRLPQAGAELEFAALPFFGPELKARTAASPAARLMRVSNPPEPDLTVITRD